MLIIFAIINGRNEKFSIKSTYRLNLQKPYIQSSSIQDATITLETFLGSKFHAIYWLLNHKSLTESFIK